MAPSRVSSASVLMPRWPAMWLWNTNALDSMRPAMRHVWAFSFWYSARAIFSRVSSPASPSKEATRSMPPTIMSTHSPTRCLGIATVAAASAMLIRPPVSHPRSGNLSSACTAYSRSAAARNSRRRSAPSKPLNRAGVLTAIIASTFVPSCSSRPSLGRTSIRSSVAAGANSFSTTTILAPRSEMVMSGRPRVRILPMGSPRTRQLRRISCRISAMAALTAGSPVVRRAAPAW